MKEVKTAMHDGHDGRAGSLVMQAIGDALGFLVEGYGPEVCAEYADQMFHRASTPNYRRGGFEFGQYSDDTQFARELAISLGSPDVTEYFAVDFGRRVAALIGDNKCVGSGPSTRAAAERLLAGVPWDEAGTPAPNAGDGAAMRAAPVGFLGVGESAMVQIADDQARVTHKDVRARAAAILVALVVAEAIRSGPAECTAQWCERLAVVVHDHDTLLADGVRMMPQWCGDDPVAACEDIVEFAQAPLNTVYRFEQWRGISPYATTAVLYALYAYLRAPSDPEEVLRVAVSVGGDVDTVAAMAGAMVGAAVGLNGLTPRLAKLASKLTDNGTYELDDLIAIARAVV